jgi:hypothetical protein
MPTAKATATATTQDGSRTSRAAQDHDHTRRVTAVPPHRRESLEPAPPEHTGRHGGDQATRSAGMGPVRRPARAQRLLRQPRTRNVLRETNSSALRRGSAAAPSHRASLVSRNHQVNTPSAAVHASVLRHRRPANSPAALGQQDRWTTPCSAAWWTPPSEATAPVGRILPPGPGVPAALLPGPRRCRLPRQRG